LLRSSPGLRPGLGGLAPSAPCLLQPRDSGLDKPSVALVCQVLTIDKQDLAELAGSLSRRTLQKIDAGLKLALDLE